jgi:hypothetical protein
MIGSLMAAALVVSAFQDPPVAPAPPQDPTVYRLEDIVVEGTRLEERTAEYVREVAAPARGRGPARWREGVCVGAANFDPEVAQYLIDRVSDVARDLGLSAGQPGCEPSILIIGTTDGASFTREFVEMRPRLFRVGGSGMDRGRAAFEDFTSSDRPVRWWHVSMPTDSETGQRTVRLPGEMRPMPNLDPRQDALGYAPITRVPVASRIQSSVEDRMMRSFVIIDVDKLGGVSLEQLGDYVAMVALVQVNPDADTGRYETILNLFEQPDSIAGLSGWDRAYMEGIYATRPGRISTMAQVQSITQAILSAYRGQLEEE